MKSIRWRLLTVIALAVVSVFFILPRSVKVRQYDPAAGRMVDRVERQVPINLGLDLRGGVHLALEVDESRGKVADCKDAIRRAEQVVRTRMDEFGTSERVVQVVGDCRLIVELPGVQDPARARAIVQRTAFLEFRLTDTRDRLQEALPALDDALRRSGAVQREAPAQSQAMSQLFEPAQRGAGADSATAAAIGFSQVLRQGSRPGEYIVADDDVPAVEQWLQLPRVQRALPRGVTLHWSTEPIAAGAGSYRALYVLESRPIITGEDLQTASAGHNPETNGVEVRFELNRAGGRKFAAATERNVGNFLAILLDGRVQGAPPVIQQRIESSGRIEMNGRSLEEANDLALVLRAGALPVPLHVVEERTIGPSLGSDSIDAGVRAALISVASVLLIIGVYYRRAGMFAVSALFLYVLYCAGGLAALGFTLTLPGLAGFALSIGMAVDANVLIFERIREELDAKKPIREAVAGGFRHALSAIVDSNVTTALTAVILYYAGTESVRGFAITLLIGLVASMISAIFVTRTFFMIWLSGRGRVKELRFHSIKFFEKSRFDFIRVRRWAYGLSGAVIVPGLLLLAVRGPKYSIEFTGGTLVHVQTNQATSTAQLRSALTQSGLLDAEVQDFGSNREFVVRARLTEAQSAQSDTASAAAIRTALDEGLGANTYQIERSERVGPKVGGELQQKAWIAVLLSFISTLIYLAFRFQWRFGAAAVIATAHDVLATIAFIGYFDIEISLVVVAGILTVLGYSLNDTIVIFDRVRERLKTRRGRSFVDALNISINETLPRTLLTGGTTMITALALAIIGGVVIRPFALVMTFGIAVGTFSSIFVAAPVLLSLSGSKREQPRPAREGSLAEAAASGPAVSSGLTRP